MRPHPSYLSAEPPPEDVAAWQEEYERHMTGYAVALPPSVPLGADGRCPRCGGVEAEAPECPHPTAHVVARRKAKATAPEARHAPEPACDDPFPYRPQPRRRRRTLAEAPTGRAYRWERLSAIPSDTEASQPPLFPESEAP